MQYQVAVVDGTNRCYETINGIDRTFAGCRHLTPREAIRHADVLASRSAFDAMSQDTVGEDHRGLSEPPDPAPRGGSPLPLPAASSPGAAGTP